MYDTPLVVANDTACHLEAQLVGALRLHLPRQLDGAVVLALGGCQRHHLRVFGDAGSHESRLAGAGFEAVVGLRRHLIYIVGAAAERRLVGVSVFGGGGTGIHLGNGRAPFVGAGTLLHGAVYGKLLACGIGKLLRHPLHDDAFGTARHLFYGDVELGCERCLGYGVESLGHIGRRHACGNEHDAVGIAFVETEALALVGV